MPLKFLDSSTESLIELYFYLVLYFRVTNYAYFGFPFSVFQVYNFSSTLQQFLESQFLPVLQHFNDKYFPHVIVVLVFFSPNIFLVVFLYRSCGRSSSIVVVVHLWIRWVIPGSAICTQFLLGQGFKIK